MIIATHNYRSYYGEGETVELALEDMSEEFGDIIFEDVTFYEASEIKVTKTVKYDISKK